MGKKHDDDDELGIDSHHKKLKKDKKDKKDKKGKKDKKDKKKDKDHITSNKQESHPLDKIEVSKKQNFIVTSKHDQ